MLSINWISENNENLTSLGFPTVRLNFSITLNRNGGLQTRMTPTSSWRPAMILKMVSLSPRMMTERMMVTTGQANTIHRESGTAMKVMLPRAVVISRDELSPWWNIKRFSYF